MLAGMRFRVLDPGTPGDLARWVALWERWPRREVMGHPEYARLFARPCDRVVCAAGEEEGGGAILFPLILRPLAAEPWASAGEERLDAVTPYGYGGPFAWGERDEGAFWRAHAAWCREARIVSTFVRLSLFPEQLAALPGGIEERARNIVVPLDGGAEALWRGYEGKVRRWVKFAEANGLETELDREGRRLEAFIRIYTHTMERHHADRWYFFSHDFFTQLFTRLAGHVALFHTLARGEVVSSDLLLCSAEHVYYFLGGTDADAFPLGPNYLLKHRIASWAAAEGKKSYVLGGGYEPDDGLFRYKRAYARRGEVSFRVARLVHDPAAYAELLAQRASPGWSPRAEFFPAYRA
jgi:GNAT acetyltransferase-like protein